MEETLKRRGSQARVLRSLKDDIDSGVLRHGDQMPSEREIAARLSANRATVRGALGLLMDEGLVRATGARTRIVHAPTQATASGRAELGANLLIANAVVVLTPHSGSEPAWMRKGGFTSSITYGVLDEIQRLGKHALTLTPNLSEDIIEQILRHRPHGVIGVYSNEADSATERAMTILLEGGVPSVVFSDPSRFSTSDHVASDHEAGAYELTKWLIGQGRRRILTLWTEDNFSYWLTARRVGYEKAMIEAGLTPLSMPARLPIQTAAEDEAAFHDRARHLAGYLIEYFAEPDPIDAIMANSDGSLPDIAAVCRLFGKTPNKDVALIGYDNYWRDHIERRWENVAPLATMDKNNFGIGQDLVRLLSDRIEGKLPAEPQTRTITPELIIVDLALAAGGNIS